MATGGITLNGSTQYLEFGNKVVSGFPFSLVAWCTWVSGTGFVLAQQQSNADRFAAAWLDGNGTSKYASTRNPGNSDTAVKTASPDQGATLRLLVAVFTSATSRTVYFADNTAVTSTTSMTDDTTNHDRVTIGAGRYNSGAANNFHNGTITEAHIFNTALTSGNVTTLLTTPPEDVAGWVDGWKLGSNTDLTSIGGTRTLTAIGSPTTGSVTLPYTRASAPVLSSPTTTGITSSGATIGCTTDTASGTLYTVVTTSATQPSIVQIKAGQTDTGATAPYASSQVISSVGAKTFSGSGLTASTTYYHHSVHEAAGIDSNRLPSSSFATLAGSTPVSFGGTVPAQTGTIGIAFSLALASYFSGGLTPFVYSVFSGSLPTGLTLNTSTGAITGTPSAAGSFTAVIRATDTGSNVANTNSVGFTISAGSSRTVTLSLTTDGVNPSANLTGLKWAFFDQVNPGSFVAPTAKGTSGTTDSSGVFTTSVVGTALSVGQVGWLLITDSNGTVSQAPPGKAFSAPVIIS